MVAGSIVTTCQRLRKQKFIREFSDGCFTLRQTEKSFPQLPIHLALEQTINTDVTRQKRE